MTQRERVLQVLTDAGSKGVRSDGYGLCKCGCGRKTTISDENNAGRGYIKGEPRPYVLGHHRRVSRSLPVESRLVEAIDFTQRDCWVWTAGVNAGGYGLLSVNGKNKLAHRATYELLIGQIPDGLELDHLCRVTGCVNPAHLEPVTHIENLRRSAPAQRTHCPKGHPYDEANTYRRPGTGRRVCRTCGREQKRRTP